MDPETVDHISCQQRASKIGFKLLEWQVRESDSESHDQPPPPSPIQIGNLLKLLPEIAMADRRRFVEPALKLPAVTDAVWAEIKEKVLKDRSQCHPRGSELNDAEGLAKSIRSIQKARRKGVKAKKEMERQRAECWEGETCGAAGV